MRHLEALLAGAAAVTLVSGCSDAKKKRPSASDDDDDDRRPRRPRESTGYAVVDPMPPPARCSLEVAPKVTGTATGKKRDDGKWDITIELEAPDATITSITQTWSPNYESSATLAQRPGGATVKAVVDASSGSVGVWLSVKCGPETGLVVVEAMWKVGHLADSPYPVTVRAQGQ